MDPYVEALRRLIDSTPGGKREVAQKAELSEATLQQIYVGTKLPSGRPKGVGRQTFDRLTAAYPEWLQLAPVTLGLSLPASEAASGDKKRESSSVISMPQRLTLRAAVDLIADQLDGLSPDQRDVAQGLMHALARTPRAQLVRDCFVTSLEGDDPGGNQLAVQR